MMMKRALIAGLGMTLGVALGAAGCKTTPVATGSANTTVTARKQLEGQWILVAMTVNSPDGKRVTPQAAGELNLDEFSNLKIEYRIADSGRSALEGVGLRTPNPVISGSGRVAIDPQRHTVTYMPPDANARALDPEAAAQRANPLSVEHLRYYTIGSNGILTLTTRYENGKEATRSTWKRATP
jgi:hypothetical protein